MSSPPESAGPTPDVSPPSWRTPARPPVPPGRQLTERAPAGPDADLLRLALEAGGVGAWSWDFGSDGLTWSENLATLCGLGRRGCDATFAGLLRLVHPDDRERVRGAAASALAGEGTGALEFRVVRPDGATRWVLARGRVVYEGGRPVRLAGVCLDVTEARQAEAVLRADYRELERTVRERTAEWERANERLRAEVAERRQAEERVREQAALLDKARDAILVTDLQGRLLYFNRSAERLYGWSAAEAVGRSNSVILHRGAVADRARAWRALFAEGEWAGELRHVTRQGQEIVVDSHWTLVRDEEGKPRSVLVINSDVTEKKKAEARQLRAQRLESIGTLAGGIAHDLNNMLTPILMGVDLLGGPLPESERPAVLETLRASAERGAWLVKQVLAFARGLEGRRAELSLAPVVKELEKMLGHTLPKSIDLRVCVPGDLWPVEGDATQLSQVLVNLCVNSRDAMPAGGALEVRVSNRVLDETYARAHPDVRPGPHVLIEVEDTGTGIPAEVLPRIFDPFFTTKAPGQGTGLGLPTAQRIVHDHGGFLDVTSAVGRGTRFLIYLPAVPGERAQEAQGGERELPAGQGELILVADDEGAVRDIARATLEAYGYRVVTANDGAEAVALYAERRAEVRAVLCDLMMPVLDGAGMIRALRQLDPGVRVIAASGFVAGGPEAVAELGGRAFLQKPYTAQALLQTVRDVLGAG